MRRAAPTPRTPRHSDCCALPSVDEVVRVRTKLNMSQPVFARWFRTEAKTIANWEQGRSKPNAQAAILLKLVDRHPDLLDEIATL